MQRGTDQGFHDENVTEQLRVRESWSDGMRFGEDSLMSWS